MRKFKFLLTVAFLFAAATVFGQTKLTGKIVDETNQPLPGATVVVQGTNVGASTDFDGNFSIETSETSGTLMISFVGYEGKTISFSGSANLGTIAVNPSAEALEEIIVVGVADIARDRKTPVAVTTIRAEQIIEKLGTQEFPEILRNTPSVYATKSGGGFGDARINIRGFDQRNTAVMINGMPVNDMENGWVYWSNWAGLSDVTTAMQVQRGLGSSKLAISSVGGTINVITKTTDRKQGGSWSTTIGNDDYVKSVVSYSTGKNKKGWASSFLLSKAAGDGYVDGTAFKGMNYFISVGLDKEDHDFQFIFTGAPQVHNQRTTSFYNMATLGDYLEYGQKYNYNHGFKDGKEFNWRQNFYHKPIMSLNWDYQISDKSKLNTVGYVSFGRGGGTGDIGRLPGYKFASSSIFRNDNGLVKWDDIVRYNQGETVNFGGSDYTRPDDGMINDSSDNGLTRRASVNSHNWFGIVSNFNTKFTDELTWDIGIDLRKYKGIHYRRLDNLLGARGYRDSDNINNRNNVLYGTYDSDLASLWNVFRSTDEEEKIDYYNDGLVKWAGLFTQLEYSKNDLSLFLQAAISTQGFKRIDYFNYLDTDPRQETDYENITGGNIKGGANWNLDENNNVFANLGYYSKQPLFDAVYINYVNELNDDYQNEKVFGAEIGYGYRSEKLRANVNLYRTSWKDRFITVSAENTAGDEGNANIQGVEQVHTGLELELNYKIADNLTLNGMASFGNWEYSGSPTGSAFDSDQNFVSDVTLYLDGVKVGDAAQTTYAIGLDYEPFRNFRADVNYYAASNLYADISAEDFDSADHQGSLELPNYSLFDAGLSYKFKLSGNNTISLRFNVNNLFDEEYLSESATNYHARPGDDTYKGIATGNKVFFGFGRTWNFGLRYAF